MELVSGVTGPFPDFAGNPYGKFPANTTEVPRGSGTAQIFFIYLKKIVEAFGTVAGPFPDFAGNFYGKFPAKI